MVEKKLAELRGFLDQLPPQEAAALARKLELQRALGQETPPAATILAGLRRQLRVAQPARTPTLFRLVAAGFEEFLVGHPGAIRMSGVIPRASIDPWWQTLKQRAPEEMKAQEAELQRLLAANDWAAIERFGAAAQRAARQWTEAALADGTAVSDPGLRADCAEIAHLLGIAAPLREAVELASTVAARLGQTQARRILEFSDETVAEARRQYLRFAQSHGVDARYVALGIMNRLERPWQILRLARALGWNPAEAATPHAELTLLADRLVHDLVLLAGDLDALMPLPGRPADTATDFRQMHQALTRYIENAEQMLGQFGLRRDSVWGERIQLTRAVAADALTPERLALVGEVALAVLPPEGEGAAPRSVPAGETIEQAMRAARFLVLLRQRGGGLGLATAVQSATDAVGAALRDRGERLYDTLARQPNDCAASAQLNAAIRIAGILFEDGRAEEMAQRLKSLQRGGAG